MYLFSGLDFCPSTFYIEDSSIVLWVVVDLSYSLMCSIAWCGHTTIYLSCLSSCIPQFIHFTVDGYFRWFPVWAIVHEQGCYLYTLLYISFCEHMPAFLLGTHLRVETLDHRTRICPALWASLPTPHPRGILSPSCQQAFPDITHGRHPALGKALDTRHSGNEHVFSLTSCKVLWLIHQDETNKSHHNESSQTL